MQYCFLLLKSSKNYSEQFLRFIKLNRLIKTIEYQKILIFFEKESNFKFVIKKLIVIKDQSNGNYAVGNESMYSEKLLKSNLRYYNDFYILVRGKNTIKRRKRSNSNSI